MAHGQTAVTPLPYNLAFLDDFGSVPAYGCIGYLLSWNTMQLNNVKNVGFICQLASKIAFVWLLRLIFCLIEIKNDKLSHQLHRRGAERVKRPLPSFQHANGVEAC